VPNAVGPSVEDRVAPTARLAAIAREGFDSERLITMPMVSRRCWLTLLVVALIMDLLLSLYIEFATLRSGTWAIPDRALQVARIGFALVAFVAAVEIARVLARRRRDLFHFEQVVAATGATASDWLWESDLDHRITYSNGAVEELLGFGPQELAGRDRLALLYDDANRDEARELIHSRRDERQSRVDAELCWRHKLGHRVWLRCSAVPILDEHRSPIGYRGSCHPATTGDAPRRSRSVARSINELLATQAVSSALQPIVDLNTGSVVGAEALARFRDNRSPDQWFRDARSVGLTKQLDALAFTRALEVFPHLGSSMYLSVNASPELLLDASFRDHLLASAYPLNRLVIEITEHAQVRDYAHLNAAIGALRKRGVRLAVDDTGAGYSSLTHVIELRPDILKLDRALITDLDTDRARRVLVTALVLLALEVGASVTGEGIETPQQLNTLTTLGVDHGQGYLFEPPTLDPTRWDDWPRTSWLPTPSQSPG
jgi:PAS domain S-box-containing protein